MSISPAAGLPMSGPITPAVLFGGSRTQAYTQQQAHDALTSAGFRQVDTPPNAAVKTYFRSGAEGIGEDIRVEVPHLRSSTAKLAKSVCYQINLAVKEAKRQDDLAGSQADPGKKRRTLAYA